MKKTIIYLLLTLCPLALFAQTAETAAEEYANSNYQQAAEIYTQLLEYQNSPELYYNLGNAYFKQGELGKSILAYERALRLQPHFKDAQYNLQFAQNMIVDNIEDQNNFFLKQWIISLRNLLSLTSWTYLSIALFIFALIAAFVFAFTRPIALRKTGFHLMWLSLLFSIFCFCFAANLHRRNIQRTEAIVMQGAVNAKSSPDRSGTDLFTLHEGTKVHIRSVVSNWAEIEVGNNRGWVNLDTIERI